MLVFGMLTMLLGVALGGLVLEVTMRAIKHSINEPRTTDALALQQQMQRQG
jgi:hypothetical protein